MIKVGDERVKQVVVGVLILLVLTVLICVALAGWHWLPGLLGDWVGTMVGLMTTPILLEFSFVVIGLTMVVAINQWRQRREGDEFVYLEQVDDSDLGGDVPEQAKWAVFREEPLAGEQPSLLDQAEGALEAGEIEEAVDLIASMSAGQLAEPRTLALRIRLAEEAGKPELAERLRQQLEQGSGEVHA